MRRLAPVIEANKVLYIRHHKCLNKLLPSCSTLSVQPTCLLGLSQRSFPVRLCCKNKTDDHRELNYLTGVENTVCSKQCKTLLPHTPSYSCAYSCLMQDNDMTDKKKIYQIKCYYLTPPLALRRDKV